MTTRDAFAWFPILAKKHDERAPRIARLDSYANGNAPLPSMNKETKEAWQAFQAKSRLNLGGLIASSAMGRLKYSGLVVGTARTEVETVANRIVRDNRFKAVLDEAFEWAGIHGEAYLMTAADENARAVITAESARHVTIAKDPLRPWVPLAMLKVWRDHEEGLDFAFVWDGIWRVQWARPIRDKKNAVATRVAGGAWEPIDAVEVGKVPITILQPTADGQGAFEPHTDVIDRCHLGILNRMTTMALQAHRSMAVEGDLPEADVDGNPIDYAETFAPGIGAFWKMPAGAKIWESQVTDITPMLGAEKTNLRDLAAVSRTSLSNLNPEGQNQTAEGARAAKDGEITRAIGYLERMKPDAELAIVRAIKIEAPNLMTEEDTLTMLFKPPAVAYDGEDTASLLAAKGSDVPWRTRMLRYGGFSTEEVDRMEQERAEEMLANWTPEAAPVAAA